jgi:hypothetical protein
MLKGPLAPNLWEMQVAWALLRICAGNPRFVKYLDFEPTGEDVARAQKMLEGEAA